MAYPYAYCTTYCNRAHRLSDGKPIRHECRILPVAALTAEMAGDFGYAQEILASTEATYMRRGVKE